MKVKKRVLALALIMLASMFGGCASGGDSSSGSQTGSETSEAPQAQTTKNGHFYYDPPITLNLAIAIGPEVKFKEGQDINNNEYNDWMLEEFGLDVNYVWNTPTGDDAVYTKLKLVNSIFALVLPGAINVWSIILLINFFRGIPKELEESATMDGAGRLRVLWSIVLPLSTPVLATLSLFTMVGHWNSWFDGMIYNTDINRYPLATLLQIIVVQEDFTKITADPKHMADISNRTVKSAQMFIAALPILMVYPFLQKHFVSGIVVGAVKG